MKTPFCDSCVKSAAPCGGCQKRIRAGELAQLDFEVAQILYKINEKHNISEASFVRALDLGRVVLIMTEGEVGLLIGRGGVVVSQISSALNKKVRIVQSSADVRKSISDIILPARLLGINTMWHGGQEVVKVRLSSHDFHQLPIEKDTLEKVIGGWMGKPATIEFEQVI